MSKRQQIRRMNPKAIDPWKHNRSKRVRKSMRRLRATFRRLGVAATLAAWQISVLTASLSGHRVSQASFRRK